MKKIIVFSFAMVLLLALSCTSEKPEEESVNPLAGVWELVIGVHNMNDTVYTVPNPELPDFKSMKIFSEGHFFTIGMGGPDDVSWSFAGTYEISGEEYTQVNIISTTGSTGNSITMKFSVENDTLRQESSRHKEVWVRLE